MNLKRQGIQLEKALYESRPVSLLLISAYSIMFPAHVVMQAAGVVLLGCTLIITKMRLRHRGYIRF
jgi:hypothetical protein